MDKSMYEDMSKLRMFRYPPHKKETTGNKMSWQDILRKKSKSRRKGGSKRAKKKGRRNRKSDKKQDACYYKVKSRYKKWPSAYASGALVRCRKVGAKNWGNKRSDIMSWKEILKGGDNFKKREKMKAYTVGFQEEGGKEGKERKHKEVGLLVELVMIKVGQNLVEERMLLRGRKRRCRPTCAACKTYKRRKG